MVVVNAGTSATLTLYDGHPAITSGPGAGTVIGTVPTGAGVGSKHFAAQLQWGLFYSYAGTAGDLTIHFRTHPV